MKRFAILLLAAATPAVAQDTNTQCRWIGTTWSCDSQQSRADRGPIDYLSAMGGLGPSYEDTELKQQQIQQNRNILEMQEAQLRAMKKAEESASRPPSAETYHLEPKAITGLNALLSLCPSLAGDLASVPDADRRVVQALCYAHAKGQASR